MSMIGMFRSLTDAELEALFKDPSIIFGFLHDQPYPSADHAQPPRWMLWKRRQPLPAPSDVSGPIQSAAQEEGPNDLDLDKMWHSIHFLLTGSAWGGEFPENFILQGREVGDVDVGYGPARGFTSWEVAQISSALDDIDGPDLLQRYDPQKLIAAEIYPSIWDRPEEEDDIKEDILHSYVRLKAFIADAASRERAMLAYLN